MSDDIDYSTTMIEDYSGSTQDKSDYNLYTLGLSQVAYCRSIVHDGNTMVAIYAADGSRMAIVGDKKIALEIILNSEMVPAFLQ